MPCHDLKNAPQYNAMDLRMDRNYIPVAIPEQKTCILWDTHKQSTKDFQGKEDLLWYKQNRDNRAVEALLRLIKEQNQEKN